MAFRYVCLKWNLLRCFLAAIVSLLLSSFSLAGTVARSLVLVLPGLPLDAVSVTLHASLSHEPARAIATGVRPRRLVANEGRVGVANELSPSRVRSVTFRGEA